VRGLLIFLGFSTESVGSDIVLRTVRDDRFPLAIPLRIQLMTLQQVRNSELRGSSRAVKVNGNLFSLRLHHIVIPLPFNPYNATTTRLILVIVPTSGC
jgi:hypothetical protein